MSTNRFLQMETYLKDDKLNRFGVRRRKMLAAAKTKDKKCPQVSEEAVGENQFVLDVLQFFFEERLQESQLNTELRDIAARAAWAATEGSKAMDLVPRPTGGKPGILWLVSQAVQIGFRAAQNRCIYEAVRRTVKLSMRSEYEIAKTVSSQSLYARQYSATTTPTAISDIGVDLIKRFESFQANLYNDPAGHCTIGYGTLVHRGNCNGTEPDEYKKGITEARATELLKASAASAAGGVSGAVTVTLNQNQFDALVSFTYSIGNAGFTGSTLLTKLNGGDAAGVVAEWRKWVKADGKRLEGLVNRREAEIELFNRPVTSDTKSFRDDWSWSRSAVVTKTITVVDSSPTGSNGNKYLENKAKKNTGCLRVDSVEDMVNKVIANAGGSKIKKLVIWGHGNKGLIVVGANQDGSVAGKRINGHESEWEPHLRKLNGKFSTDGEIFLGGCNVGAGAQGAAKMKKIADITGVKIVAPTGKTHGDCTEESGSVHQVAMPGQPAPAPIESPSDSKKLKVSTSHSMSKMDWTNMTPNVEEVYIHPSRLSMSELNVARHKAQTMDAVKQFVDGIDNTRKINTQNTSGIINAYIYVKVAGSWEEYIVFSDYDYFLRFNDWANSYEVKWGLKQHLMSIIEGSNLFV